MKKLKYKKFSPLVRGRKRQFPRLHKTAFLWLWLGAALLVIIPAFLLIRSQLEAPKANVTSDTVATPTPPKEVVKPTPPKPIPANFDITVPYAKQAPFSNWTVHEESCEEAALAMYNEFLTGNRKNVSLEDGRLDLLYKNMKSWQVTNYGKEPDLNMTTLGAFASSYYGYVPHVKKSITADDIKAVVSSGSPVMVPVMTHSLENSMYGPYTTYHVLLIKGYDATGVITNDAGVGNGQNKHYTWAILWQAIDAQTSYMDGQGREMLYLTK